MDILEPPRSREESIYEEDEAQTPREEKPPDSDVRVHPFSHRRRAGSVALSTQSRAAASTPVPRIPAFPSTHALLAPFIQFAATLPKHYPPPSLLMLALSKQWKNRFIVLTSPAQPTRASEGPAVSYLHLFKSSGQDEKELERLEINENSVIYVTDEEIGSRRNIIKVGGIDVGGMKKELNSEENGLTMMLLQIVDSAESQKWMNAIKNAVLGQRSIRAGLGLPSLTMGGTEPRGDLDVMLSMRMQGFLPSPTQSSFQTPSSPTHTSSHEDSMPPTQPSTLRSRPSSPRSPNAVLSLKGLFTGSSSRPRSPSRAVSPDHDPDASSESFASVGTNLLNIHRANTLSLDSSPIIKPYSMLPPSGPALEQLEPPPALQRKIVQNRTSLDWVQPNGSTAESPSTITSGQFIPPARALSPSSLQPPPHRKRAWTTHVPASQPEPGLLIYNHGNASTAGSFGIALSGELVSSRPSLERPRTSTTPVQKPRASSVSSVSTLGSNERENNSLDRPGSASGSGRRRWSRQLAIPKRLTPPAGAPPPVPLLQSWQSSSSSSPPQNTHRLSHPYSPDRPGDRPPSRSSSLSHKTLPSIVSSLHMGSKRASVSSSVYSIATNNTNSSSPPSATLTRSINSNRLSVPPPQRPAPNTALPPTPPTPIDVVPQPVSAPPLKTSFRDSLAHRALRLSMIPPTSPPSNVLPPRPDEPAFRAHHRSASIDTPSPIDTSASIPASLPDSPFPPPTGPLPPPPSPSIPSTPRLATAFKQRLRILSAPSSPSPAPRPLPLAPVVDVRFAAHAYTPPATPIAERITLIQNDPDYLTMSTPPPTPAAPLPPPRSPFRPPPPERSPGGAPEMTSLSPPPRRGSRFVATPDREKTKAEVEAVLALPEDASAELGEPDRQPSIDLSRNASTLSLGIVSDARP
ncbi:hypothetical protein BV25DRAFT_228700 [Artomyces pyxidatus]|uniref:Uncharacterized protein n=1 Tax=Artomyces pyxidatus TaxID=48021 RepID=A0ACB8SGC6_9AGAM|nr:hypothetical protein BV25DRAFT_228700 [Artomyces pyxidatus]